MAANRVTFYIHKNGQPIESLEDWYRLAPPEGGSRQWKDGRSAKETARRWLQGLPPEVSAALDSHADLAGFTAHSAEPEVETELDEFFRSRNHDLIVEGTHSDTPVLLCVEAKADEAFDETVEIKLERASPASNIPERIRRISLGLFGHGRIEEISDLRYQLLQTCAASLIETHARQHDRCVLLVHTFRTHATDDERMAENVADLSRFVSSLSNGAFESVPASTAVGPISVPGHMAIPRFEHLFIAQAEVDLTLAE